MKFLLEQDNPFDPKIAQEDLEFDTYTDLEKLNDFNFEIEAPKLAHKKGLPIIRIIYKGRNVYLYIVYPTKEIKKFFVGYFKMLGFIPIEKYIEEARKELDKIDNYFISNKFITEKILKKIGGL